MRTVLILLCLFLQSCVDSGVESSLDGKWVLSYAKTCEYREPDARIIPFRNIRNSTNDIESIFFDTGNKSISFSFISRETKKNRYRVIKNEKNIFIFDNDGKHLSIESYGDNAILMCPSGGSAKQCSVFIAAKAFGATNPDKDVVYIESNVSIYTGIKSVGVEKYIAVSLVFSSKNKEDILLVAGEILRIKDSIAEALSSKTPTELEDTGPIKNIILTSLAQVTGISSGVEVEITKKDIF